MFYCDRIKIQLGICLPVSRVFEAENFDFLELSLSEVMDQTEEDFYILKNNVKKNKFNVPAMNCLFPRNLPIVGTDIDIERIKNYLKEATKRANELGCKLLVLGSGNSRRYSNQYKKNKALWDLKLILQILQQYAENYEIRIAIEPICSLETNLLNNMQQVSNFIRENKLSKIKMICDTYHLRNSEENLKDIEKYIGLIEHFHISNKKRFMPIYLEKDLKEFFELVDSLNYKKLISIEALIDKETSLFIPEYLKK